MAEGGEVSSQERLQDQFIIIPLGKSGAGKSTLINKLISSDDIIPISLKKGTIKIDKKRSTDEKLIAIDAPGLEASNHKEWKKVLKDLIEFEDGKTHFVLLCIPIGPGFRFADGTPEVMKYMQEIFGKDVWKNCIVVFTFSNLAHAYSKTEKDYLQLLETNTGIFRDELRKLKVKDVEVKTIVQHKHGKAHGIVTIPAGMTEEDKEVNPNQERWIDAIFELMEEKRPDKQFILGEYRKKRTGEIVGGVAGVAGGAAAGGIGAGIGVGVGAVGGPPGMLIGGVVGGVGGALVGAAVGGTAGVTAGRKVAEHSINSTTRDGTGAV